MDQQSGDKEEHVYELSPVGELHGHGDWITSICAGHSQKENEDPNILISGSRDHKIIIWKLFEQAKDNLAGNAFKSLSGHNHFVSDLALSQENQFLLSSSWDKTIRLWDLRECKTTKTFIGHTKEIFSVSFSPDNRQIISAGADREIKLWNNLAECKFTSDTDNHSDWVSCVRYSPVSKTVAKNPVPPYFASVGWDGRLKIWNPNFQIRYSFKAHEGNINSISISPNGKYLATGGKDKKLNIWDLNDLKNSTNELEAGSTINQLSFNPKLQLVAAGTEQGVKIWDLANHSQKPIQFIEEKGGKKKKNTQCTSVTWNALGNKLFAGFSDGIIRVYDVSIDKDKTN